MHVLSVASLCFFTSFFIPIKQKETLYFVTLTFLLLLTHCCKLDEMVFLSLALFLRDKTMSSCSTWFCCTVSFCLYKLPTLVFFVGMCTASGHALTSITPMKLFLSGWLCLLIVWFSTCSAAPQKEQTESRKTHNICDLLRSRNIRWISVTLWIVWWVPRCPIWPPHSVHWPCTRKYAQRYTHAYTQFEPVQASPRPRRPISLTTHNDLSGAVKPAAKIKIRSYITARYDASSCAHSLAVSENRCSLIFVWVS